MSAQTKREVLAKLRPRYARAGKEYKTKILNEFIELFGLHRKAAIRALRRATPSTRATAVVGRPREYDAAQLLPVLKPIWLAAQQPCGKRWVAALPDWVPAYREEVGKLSTELEEKLLGASAATLDRLLQPLRLQHRRRLGGTRPGSLLRQHIPIRPDAWDLHRPGFLEVDTVALCGGSLEGDFVWMLDSVDFATQWVEARALWNRGQHTTLEQIGDIEARLPFELLGLDCDNGGEFLNWHLYRWTQQRPRPVALGRSRPYHKDDNAHIEQKNWTHIRQWFGYSRYDNPEVVARINALTRGAWAELLNYFCPVMKLKEKARENGRLRRVYDEAATPYARVLANAHVPEEKKAALRKIREKLQPFALHRQTEKELKVIFAIAQKK